MDEQDPPPASPNQLTLDRLKRWRDEGKDRNEPGYADIKDRQLQTIANMPGRGAAEIQEKLTKASKGLAAAIEGVLENAAQEPTSPAPPAAATAAEPTPSTGLEAADTDFAAFDFTAPVNARPAPLRIAAVGSGGHSLTWGAPPPGSPGHAAVTIYRLVSGDTHAPWAPENGEPLAVTAERRATDARPFAGAVRYFQVWCHSGADETEARLSQPHLLAQTVIVSPVKNLDVREDEGRVIGEWDVWPGIERVQVFRVPIERAGQESGSPQHRIHAAEPNLGGLVDRDAERGKQYLYQVFAEVSVGGVTRLSMPLNCEVLVSAVLEPVTDLAVHLYGADDDPMFDLTWTPPTAGRVVIFRTPQAPQAGASLEARPEPALGQMLLTDGARLSHPVTIEGDDRASMRNVPWPRAWDRTYFTPVTLLDGMAHVGTTKPAVRTRSVSSPRVVERVNTQILTFAWPMAPDSNGVSVASAASVLVYIGAPDQDADLARAGKPVEISFQQYQQLGGLHFPKTLPDHGCSLHIVATSYVGGQRVEGAPVSIQYPGVFRLAYRTVVRRGLTRKATSVSVSLTADRVLDTAPPLVLVHHPSRLPLDLHDGEALEVVREGDEAAAAIRRFTPAGLSPEGTGEIWKADVHGREGFVRVFVDLPPERLVRVALCDPPVGSLRLGRG